MPYKIFALALLILSFGDNYRLKDEILLTAKNNGLDGKLQLLVDAKMPAKPDESELDNYAPAELRVLSKKGTVVQRRVLTKANASLEPVPELPTWNALMEDYSIGFGSYAGPSTSFVRVRKAKLEWLQALNKATGKVENIELTLSLKTVWRIDTSNGAQSPRILKAACRPSFSKPTDKDKFEMIYTVFYPTKNGWVKVERKEEGYADFETSENFPDLSKFDF